ncbi:MAG: DUF131 domain-containing protein [Nitrososphaerota archaeon]|nr:DUF131 domain-containing protein [Nitrososphaerota archaeon]
MRLRRILELNFKSFDKNKNLIINIFNVEPLIFILLLGLLLFGLLLRKAEGGALIMIGPFPIIIGNNKKIIKFLLIITALIIIWWWL